MEIGAFFILVIVVVVVAVLGGIVYVIAAAGRHKELSPDAEEPGRKQRPDSPRSRNRAEHRLRRHQLSSRKTREVVGFEISGAVAERAQVTALRARSFTIPTDHAEADGTLSWNSTTLVLVEVDADGHTGLGYSYTSAAAAEVTRRLLHDAVLGGDAHSPPAIWQRMRRVVRNVGYPGLVASAISAVDVALWDLKARLLGLALSTLHRSVCASGYLFMARVALPRIPTSSSSASCADGPSSASRR